MGTDDLHHHLSATYRAGRDAASGHTDRVEAGLAAVFAHLATLATEMPQPEEAQIATPVPAEQPLASSGDSRTLGDRLRALAGDMTEARFTAAILGGFADEADHLEAERNGARIKTAQWKARYEQTREECRYLHQEGLSRHDWHAKHCGAVEAADTMRAQIQRVLALAQRWDDDGQTGIARLVREAVGVVWQGDGVRAVASDLVAVDDEGEE